MQKKKPVLFLLLILIPFLIVDNALADDCAPQGQISGSYTCYGTMITQDPCTVESGTSATLVANQKISLKPGFWAKYGSSFIARIDIDLDNDGLPDLWELGHFGTLAYGPNDDPDGDQLTNLEEYLLGTDPNFYDTDHDDDGLPDRWEADNFGNLSQGPDDDYDSDGFTNIQEYNVGTNPTDPNSKPEGTVYNLQYDSNGNLIRMEKP